MNTRHDDTVWAEQDAAEAEAEAYDAFANANPQDEEEAEWFAAWEHAQEVELAAARLARFEEDCTRSFLDAMLERYAA